MYSHTNTHTHTHTHTHTYKHPHIKGLLYQRRNFDPTQRIKAVFKKKQAAAPFKSFYPTKHEIGRPVMCVDMLIVTALTCSLCSPHSCSGQNLLPCCLFAEPLRRTNKHHTVSLDRDPFRDENCHRSNLTDGCNHDGNAFCQKNLTGSYTRNLIQFKGQCSLLIVGSAGIFQRNKLV